MLVRCQYTVQNQKDDETCSRILTLYQHNEDTTMIDSMRAKIESEYERHKLDVQEKRAKSAQIRAIKIRERKLQQKNPVDDMEISD
jgi:hypothetical protein